jgi:hypothetical protein
MYLEFVKTRDTEIEYEDDGEDEKSNVESTNHMRLNTIGEERNVSENIIHDENSIISTALSAPKEKQKKKNKWNWRKYRKQVN